ncbi:hypothetical protein NXS19_013936 [Fusarium pseudograminearum]|nr:hypothetical protein NXS19_013936 [Fusarium pseudograminearum]
MAESKPTLRWGIVGTGMISSWFIADLTIDRKDAKATHIIQAIGSSSVEKGKKFVKEHLPNASKPPTIYGSYQEAYQDPEVDIIYIGTPHGFHKKNCLDAISHGKNVLCEKAFTLNAKEAREVFEAAKEKGVFIMEAMWTRFFPLVKTIQKLVHEDKVIGDVARLFADFAMDQHIESLAPEHRLRDLSLGAGSLLDIGIYSLTWGLVGLDSGVGEEQLHQRSALHKPLSRALISVLRLFYSILMESRELLRRTRKSRLQMYFVVLKELVDTLW